MARKPKMTRAERLLRDARNNPSPKSRDPRRLDLIDALNLETQTKRIQKEALDRLDEVIKRTLKEAGR